MENRFKEVLKTNEDTIKLLQKEVTSIRKEFNDRLDGMTRKIEPKVTSNKTHKTEESLNKLKTELNSKTPDIDRNLRKVSEGIVHIEKNTIPTVNEKLGDEIDEWKRQINTDWKCTPHEVSGGAERRV